MPKLTLTQEELAEQLYQIYHLCLRRPFVDWKEFRADESNQEESNAWAIVAKQAQILLANYE